MGRIFGKRFDGESPGGLGCAAVIGRERALVGGLRSRFARLDSCAWRLGRRSTGRPWSIRPDPRPYTLERSLEGCGVLIAFVGVPFQRTKHDLIDLGIEAWHSRRERCWLPLQD